MVLGPYSPDTMDWRDAEREYTDEVIGETTIPRMFFDAVDRYGDMEAQRYKGGIQDRSLAAVGAVPEAPEGEYTGITYEDMGTVVRRLATGFRELGIEPDDRVGIYSDTRMEWAQSDLALQSTGAVVTTVYTESSATQVHYLLDDPGATGVVVEDAELLETIGEVEDDLDLELVVVIEDVDTDRDDIDAELHTLGEVYELGRDAEDDASFEEWLDERDVDDLSSMVYTSGTTGDPKGVELTHWNWRSCVNQARKRIGPRPDKDEDVPVMEAGKTALAFLPLAHSFERFNHFSQLASGLTIAYAESTDTVGDDIAQVQPNTASSVPRVYERIYNQMLEQASESALKKRIFDWAVATAQSFDAAEEPGALLRAKHAIADRLVYSTVRENLGGNVEMFVSGGGSLSEDLARLYRAMGITIVEGYGLTETSPALTLNPPEDIKIGTIGPSLVDVELALDPTVVEEETKQGTEGEVGELLARGPNVFERYWNKSEKTESAFTEHVDALEPEGEAGPEAAAADGAGDGRWFRTGDVVARDGDGFYRFVDRVKNLIVLDTGKNIAPEPIEDAFVTRPEVDQVMVVGDDEKFIGAIVVPNLEEMRSWAREEEIELPESDEEAVADERVVDWVGEAVEAVNEDLGHHEEIKEFRVASEEWTADNDMLTPSMKKKRRNIREEHGDLLDEIYGGD